MKLYFAPLEGITGYIYRRVHHAMFAGAVDKYFIPFVAANYTNTFKGREKADVAPENNAGIPVVPQILANRPEEFSAAAKYLYSLGYREVNLNLGCPVPTITAKKRGSGMLADPALLESFLEQIFLRGPEDMRISIKTRIGVDDPAEAGRIFDILSQFPASELIIHPRTRRELYKGIPHLDVYEKVSRLQSDQTSLCYNGNVCTWDDYDYISSRFGSFTQSVMIGRGLIADPLLAVRIRAKAGELQTPSALGGYSSDAEINTSDARLVLKAFHKALYDEYKALYVGGNEQWNFRRGQGAPSGELVLVNRMKEIWAYMGRSFSGSERYLKEIRKARAMVAYEAAVRMLFANCAAVEPSAGLPAEVRI